MEDTLIQAAAEGIGVYFSSGDNGDESSTFGFPTTDWPASSPWVTAVGGTSLGVTQDNTRALETGWGTSTYSCDTTTHACTRSGWLYGSGGGVSVVFPKPWYQSGLNISGRGVPDVAAVGDPNTGFLVGQTQTFPDGVLLRRVPHRRHEPLVAALRGPDGARRSEGRASSTALRTPPSTRIRRRSRTCSRSRQPSRAATS